MARRKYRAKAGPGSGRFERCVAAVEARGSARDPRAVCAVAGRRKYGAAQMAEWAAAGRRAVNPSGGTPGGTYDRSDLTTAWARKWYALGFTTAQRGLERGVEVDPYSFFAHRYPGQVGSGGRQVEAKEYFLGGFHDGLAEGKRRNSAFNIVRGGGWIQEWYETVGGEARRRAGQLRRLGYRVAVQGMGPQVTSVGRINLTLVDVRPGSTGDAGLDRVPAPNPTPLGESDLSVAFDYGFAEGEASAHHDQARREFTRAAFRKWLHQTAERKRERAELETEWRRGYQEGAAVRFDNPADSAAALYEVFHGAPSQHELEFVETLHVHEDLVELGVMKELELLSPVREGFVVPISFEVGTEPVYLASDERGVQLFFVGGDQSLNLEALRREGFPIDETKEKLVIGPVLTLTYHTAKHHLRDGRGPGDYIHVLGEDGGQLPVLLYDRVNRLLELASGTYEVQDVGIVN